MAADGSNPVRLADGTSPAWSPDGTRVAYGRHCCFLGVDGSGLAVISPEGGLPSVLHRGTVFGKPVWSPDGSAIAFAEETGADVEAMIMPASGGAAEILVGGPGNDRPTSWK
jgi:Tol biopolymer transport system component